MIDSGGGEQPTLVADPPSVGFLTGGGEMGERMRVHDWSTSPLGDPQSWPQSLRSIVALMINSKYPMFIAWGPELAFLYNDGYVPIFGAKHPHTLGLPFRQVWPEIWSDISPLIGRALAGEATFNEDLHLVMQRNDYPEDTWYSFSYSPVRDDDGAIAGIFCACTETTQRMLAEQSLRESEARFRNMADHAPMMMWVTEPDGSCTYLNKAWYEFTGQAEAEALGFGWLEAVHPEDREAAEQAFLTANAKHDAFRVDYRLRRHDGAYRWAIDAASPRFGEQGEYLGYVGSVIDIDERRDMEQALREVGERATREAAERAAILGQLSEGVIVADAQGKIIFVNEAATDLHGVASLDVGPTDYSNTYHLFRETGEPFPFEELPLARAVMKGETVTDARWRIRRPDGSDVLAIGNAQPVTDESGEQIGSVLTIRDDTSRFAVEQSLRAERQNLETLNRAGSAIAAELDLESVVQTVTDAGVELTGAQFGAFFYNVIDDAGERYMLFTISGADRSQFEAFGMPRNTSIFAPTFAGSGVIRSDDITKDPRYGHNAPHHGMPKGHLPVASYLAVPVTGRTGEVVGGLFFGHSQPAQFEERHETLMTGIAAQAAVAIDNARLYRSAQREIENRMKVEQSVRMLNETLEHRVAEEVDRRTVAEEALRQAQKMEAIGQLTGGIAHDFNNLLQIITGNLDILKRSMPEDASRLHRSADNAMKGAERAAVLTQRLLAFSRRQPLEPKVIDANKLVNGMSDLLHRTLGETYAIETVTAPGLWRVEADPNQLENTLLNLAINARDAMPSGGKLTIETANTHIDRAYADRHSGVSTGQYVVICVSDTGSGMDPDTVERAVEPFFTTKEVGKGTGLGLSMVYGFVKQSGGHLKIYSEVDAGTTVKIYLPRHIGDETIEPHPAAERAPTGGAEETILLCEDDEDVRAFSRESLQELGYRVIEAADGESALALLTAHDGRVDLLFTDVVLPGMTGAVLADQARALRPDLKVLFTTGYARNAIVHHGRLDAGVELLSKPFTFADLSARLRDLLDGPATEEK